MPVERLLFSAVSVAIDRRAQVKGDPAAAAGASGGPCEWSSVAEVLPGHRRSSSWK
jgi:hypothetical protein